MSKFRVAVLVSGGGSNMEALIQAAKQGVITHAEFVLVISNKPEAGAIAKARSQGIPVFIIPSKGIPDDQFQKAILKYLLEHKIDIVCLAGYLKKVGHSIIQRYQGRILNIHPALLPKYGGAGMYGRFVHEAVLKAGDHESGCSVHLVDDEFDHGQVLAQARVPVIQGDTPEQLAARILEQEHTLYARALEHFCEQRVASEGAIDD